MSHLHFPDGFFPLWLWSFGYFLIAIYFIFLFFYSRNHGNIHEKLPLIGITSALMLVTTSISIFSYHLNISALSGIILGPVYSMLSIFIVNILQALLGHGGITVVGLNTVIISIEAMLAFFIFKFLVKKSKKVFISGFLAAFLSLFISSWLTVGLLFIQTKDLDMVYELKHHHHSEQCAHTDYKKKVKPNTNKDYNVVDLKRFIAIFLIMGMFSWSIEGIITGFIITYIKKVKPEIIEASTKIEMDKLN